MIVSPHDFDQAARALGLLLDELSAADFDGLSAQDPNPVDAALRADMLLSASGALQVIGYHAVAVSLGFVRFISDQLDGVTVDTIADGDADGVRVAGHLPPGDAVAAWALGDADPDPVSSGFTRDELVDIIAAQDPDADLYDDDDDDDDDDDVDPFTAPPAGGGWKS